MTEAVNLRFTVPGQPIGKSRARIGRVAGQARMFTPDKTVRYEGLVAHAAHEALCGQEPFSGPVAVEMVVACAVPASWSKKKTGAALCGEVKPTTKPDIDNVVKAVFDGMNGVAWRDDVQVVRLTVQKWYSSAPAVHVNVWAEKGKSDV